MTQEKTETHPLAAEDFNHGCGFIFRGTWLCEDEDGSYVYAYGHLDKATYAAAVNDFDEENGADAGDPYTAEHVEHHWSVATQPADGPDGWWIEWNTTDDEPITATTPNAFPLTVVTR